MSGQAVRRAGITATVLAGAMMVAGPAAAATGSISPLTEVWNGSAWTAVTAPR